MTKIIELQVSQREISYLPFLPLSQILPENRRDSKVNDETISLFTPEKIAGMKHIPSVSYCGWGGINRNQIQNQNYIQNATHDHISLVACQFHNFTCAEI